MSANTTNTTAPDEARLLAGYRGHKIAADGTLSICLDGREQGIVGDEDWRWIVTCERHDTICSFATLRVARSFLGATNEFCAGCQEEEEGQ